MLKLKTQKEIDTANELFECYEIDSLLELRKILFFYTQIIDIKDYVKRDKKLRKEIARKLKESKKKWEENRQN